LFDLALSTTGDLIFEQNTDKIPPLKISFFVSQSKPLKIQFDTDSCFPANRASNALGISFDIDTIPNNKRAILVYDVQAMVQLIEFRLNTPEGQIVDRDSIGSKLELVKHLPLYDTQVQALATSYVKTAIADIMPNAVVEATPVIDTDNGYSQCLNILIYDNGILIFKYQIKE
jgi:hypothetical protein